MRSLVGSTHLHRGRHAGCNASGAPVAPLMVNALRVMSGLVVAAADAVALQRLALVAACGRILSRRSMRSLLRRWWQRCSTARGSDSRAGIGRAFVELPEPV